MAKEIPVKVNVETNEANKNLEELNDNLQDVASSEKEVTKEAMEMPGALGQAQQGVNKLGKSLKLLLANPIVLFLTAVVGALTLIFNAFRKTQEGADKFSEVLAGIGGVLDELTARLAKLGSAIVKVFKGDFKGAAEDAKASVMGIGEAIKSAYNAEVELERQQNKIFENETRIIKLNAQRAVQLAEQKKLSEDMRLSAEQRIEAIEKANEIERAMTEDALDLERQKFELVKAQIAATPEALRSREQNRELAEAEAAFEEVKVRSLEKQTELQNKLVTAIKEKEAAETAYRESLELSNVEVIEMFDIEKELEQEHADFLSDLDKEIEAENKRHNETLLAQEKERLSEEEAAAIAAEQRKAQAKMIVEQATFGAIKMLAEDNAELSKAIAIAEAIWNTYKGATASLALGGPWGIAAAVATLAFGMVQVYKIASTDVGSGGSGGGGGSVPVPPNRFASNRDIGEIINEPAEGVQTVNANIDANQMPIKTYVVSRDMTSQQDLDKRIEEQATL